MICEDDWDPSSSTARHTSVSECASLATSVADDGQCDKQRNRFPQARTMSRIPLAAVTCHFGSLEKSSVVHHIPRDLMALFCCADLHTSDGTGPFAAIQLSLQVGLLVEPDGPVSVSVRCIDSHACSNVAQPPWR